MADLDASFLNQTVWVLNVALFGASCGMLYLVYLKRKKIKSVETSALNLSSVVETANDAIITIDEQSIISYFNPSAERMFGHRSSEIIGRHLSVIIPEKFRAQHEAGVDRFMRTGAVKVIGRTVELLGLRHNGEEFPLELSLSHCKTESGLYFTGIVRDIQSRRNLESENERLVSLVRNTQDFIGIASLDRKVFFCNEAALAMVGLDSLEQAGALFIDDYFSPDEIPYLHGTIIPTVLEQGHWQGESKFIHHKTRQTIYMQMNAFIIKDPSTGAFDSLATVSRDITDQRLRDLDRLAHREQLDKAQQIAHFGSWSLDLESTALSWSAETYRIFGLDPEHDEISLEKIRAMAHPDYDQKNRELMKEALVNHKPYSLDYRIIRPSGEIRDVRGDVEVVVDAKSKPIKIFGTIQDVTEKKKTELELVRAREAALEASRLKSEFLANMSHEIRTPINGVVGMTSLLLTTELSSEQTDFVETIKTSAESLMTIINDILDFSKIEAGKLELETVSFELNHFIEEIEKPFVFATTAKGLAFNLEKSLGDRATFLGDPGRIRQILNNLISNALKFTKQGGLTLSVTQNVDESLRFEVRDSGIGISAEVLGRLFKPFTQGDSSTTRKFGGTGLGLSICKQLVEIMGGRIGAESIEGQGSVFWFELRLKRARAEVPAIGKSSQIMEGSLSDADILVAEDNMINQKIARMTLEKMGYRVVIANNGREATELIAKSKFDLVLMDCQMPEMDGYEATRFIRKMEAPGLRNIPVIAMTANALTGDREKCLAAGMSDYVSKPVKADDLATVIERWLKISRSNDYGAA